MLLVSTPAIQKAFVQSFNISSCSGATFGIIRIDGVEDQSKPSQRISMGRNQTLLNLEQER